jgi:hypothetical protein
VCAGKKYVCELAAMPVHMLSQEELATLLLFQVYICNASFWASRIRIRNYLYRIRIRNYILCTGLGQILSFTGNYNNQEKP